jgi:hypothetical protein
MLATHERPAPTASRIQGSRSLLGGLRRLQVRADRAGVQRARSVTERAWCHQVGDVLGWLIGLGERCLPPDRDPRRRVRKRTLLF